jgi:hypothetical protein
MESTVRAPQAGDTVFVFVKMKSGKLTELSGFIEEIYAKYVYFAVNAIELLRADADDDGQALERKLWAEAAPKLLRVGVPLDEMKPFDGALYEDTASWEVRI